MEFKELGFSDPVMESLHRLGFTTPTPIQEQAIPPLLQGRDLLGRAETGSGKTLAFGLPLIEKIEAGRVSIQALVVCPTRELAQQVAEDLSSVGQEKGIKVALVVGGVHVRTQRLQIPGKQVVVGTPGRIIDLLTDRFLPVEWVEYFVLDEFDRLLDMGFLDDIKRIVKRLPRERQTALFSATVPRIILREAANLLNNPVQIEIGSARRAVDTIKQRAVRTSSPRKLSIVEHILKEELARDGSVIIFCNTKRAVRLVDRELWAKNFSVAALSGDHEQSVRFKVMERFRNQEIRVLVATDVAARGLDIDHIGHVINFDVPFEAEDYMHRIGRTGRAGRDGVVTTLIGGEDYQKFERIRRHIEQDIEMLSERCQPLEKKPKRSKARGAGKFQEGPGATVGEETPSTSSTAQEGDDQPREERPRRSRQRGRRRRDPEDRGGEEQSQDASPAREKADAEDRPKQRRSRRRERGQEGRSRQGSKDRSKESAGDGERKPPARKKRSRRRASEGSDRKDGSSQDSRRRRSRSSSRDRDGSGSGSPDRKTGEREQSGERRHRRGQGRQRRSPRDHERWERDQLNRPIELIEDNWQRVDSFGKGVDEKGRGQDNDNAPAPLDASDKERAAMAGNGNRRRSGGRRRQRGRQEDSRTRGRDSSKDENAKPGDGGGDSDIVW